MADFLETEVVANQALAVNTSYSFDLGVNGISYLWFQVAALQSAVNTPVQPDNLLAVLDTLNVLFNGQALWSGRALDLARMGAIITGVCPWFTHAAQAANADVAISFVIPFGRRLLDPAEGLMAVQRGQLILQMIAVSALTNIVTPRVSVQQVEVVGNRFQRYNKVTSRVTTPAATGNVDIPLPLGNVLRGALVNMTTRYRNINTQGSMQSAILRVQNVERYWTGGQIGHQMHVGMSRLQHLPELGLAAKLENTAAAYTQNASTTQDVINTLELLRSYSYMDLDPTRDDTYSLNTAGQSQIDLRLNMQIADQLRVMPYESVAIGGAASVARVGA